MKKLLLVILLLYPFFLSAQNCKYQKNEIDKFTKKRVKITKPKQLWAKFSHDANTSIKKVDTTTHLLIDFTISSYSKKFSQETILVDEGFELYLLLANDKVIKLFSDQYVEGYLRRLMGTVTLRFEKVPYILNQEQIDLLMRHEIKSVRYQMINSSKQLVDHDIEIKSRKNRNKIKGLLSCVF